MSNRIFKPLRDKIIIEVDNQEQRSAGGLILAPKVENEDMKREEGFVRGIGKSCFYDTEQEDLKIGDRVAFAKYSGKILDTLPDGNQLRVLRDIDILCIIE